MMPQVVIINCSHVGVFSSEDVATKWAEKFYSEATYQIVDLDVFYETDFAHDDVVNIYE